MTLENNLRNRLSDLAPGRQAVVIEQEGGWSIQLDLERGDALSCLLWEVQLRRDTPLPGDVRAWADRIAGKVTGLLEPLRVLEVDRDQQALLRSDTPSPREAGVQFYEVRLHGTSTATLRRYQGYPHSGEQNQSLSFALTHEVLAKFIADVTAEK